MGFTGVGSGVVVGRLWPGLPWGTGVGVGVLGPVGPAAVLWVGALTLGASMLVVAGGGNTALPSGVEVEAGAAACAAVVGTWAAGAGPAWKGLVISAGWGC